MVKAAVLCDTGKQEKKVKVNVKRVKTAEVMRRWSS